MQQAVERFVIGERGVGEVAFIGPVNVLGLDLDSAVHFSRGRVQVYGAAQGLHLPPPGEGLNVPALLFFQLNLRSQNAHDLAAFQAKLEERGARNGGRFVHYDPRASVWIVKVAGF